MAETLGVAAAAWGVLMAISPLLQIRRMLERRSSADVSIAYLAVRLSSEERYYFLEFQANETNGALKVRKRVDGSTTDLIPSVKTNMPVGPGTWYTIGLSAVGTTIAPAAR